MVSGSATMPQGPEDGDPFMFAAVKTEKVSFQSDPGGNIDVDT